ncbi:MAG TPA: efflux transporter outer membrane subunit [Terracidiphilus sp.]|jgi:multidrug efflux system outer membrane protein
MERRVWHVILALVFLSGCKVGPNYARPAISTPDAYRQLAPDQQAQPGNSLGDERWWEVFQDQELQALIHEAVKQNYDVRVAAERVLQAQAILGITRADQFPFIAAGASAANVRIPTSRIGAPVYSSPMQVGLSLTWQLDFWGQYRRATEAARASLLSTEWGQKAVISSVVADVASAYFQLLELDLEMDISARTLQSRKDSLRLVQIRQTGGTGSLLDVRQSEELMYTAAAAIPDLERRIAQQENVISVLLGRNPGAVPRAKKLNDTAIAPSVPAGVPSSLLERRPDIQSAEQQLVAANARIGVAKAAFFPQIALTGNAGFQSSALTSLFSGPAGLWSIGAGLAQPIFTGGKLRSNLHLTESQKQEAVLRYQQSIQQAFRDVSDSLITYRKNQDFREQQALLTTAAVDATRLANARYTGGVASYLEVLDTDTLAYDAEIELAKAQLDERLALVQLYHALGGGWQS